MKSLLKYWLQRHDLFIPLTIQFGRLKNMFRSGLYRLILLPKKGSGYSCNFCGAKYSRFIDLKIPKDHTAAFLKNRILDGYGPNNICPKCLSLSRERLVKIAIEHFFIGNNKRFLLFGPSQKEFAMLRKIGEVTTIDLQPAYYRHIDPAVVSGDITQLPFGDEVYDYVVANHILEHVSNDMAAMKEMCRVLKNGGTALLQVPYSEYLETSIEQPDINDPRLRASLFGQADHVRIYALKDYAQRLQKAGFTVEIMRDGFLQAYRQFALQQNEVIVLARKIKPPD